MAPSIQASGRLVIKRAHDPKEAHPVWERTAIIRLPQMPVALGAAGWFDLELAAPRTGPP